MYRLLLAALAAAEECELEHGVCLLSLRAHTGAKAVQSLSVAKRSWVSRQEELRAWGKQHAELKQQLMHVASGAEPLQAAAGESDHGRLTLLDKSKKADGLADSWLDDFVAAQTATGDACHAKVLEAKRTLDGLSAKALGLSDSIEGHEAVIEGNTQLIRDGMEGKENGDDTRAKDDAQCEDEHADALEENQKYRRELDELDQMANPAVRSSIAHDMDVEAEIKAHLEAKKLLTADDAEVENAKKLHAATTTTTTLPAAVAKQMIGAAAPMPAGMALVESCSALSQFLDKVQSQHSLISKLAPPAPADGSTGRLVQLDCNATRESLQKQYTEAYIEISKLFKEGEELAADNLDLCKQRAADKHTGNDAIVDAKLTKATRAVQAAKDVIEEFQPQLEQTKMQVAKLEAHITSLQTTCVVDEEVTSHLKKVRMLIDSLDKCPGRNDFQLTVPTVTGKLPDEVLQAATHKPNHVER